MAKERGVVSARHFYFTRCKTSCFWKYLERCRTMRSKYCHVNTALCCALLTLQTGQHCTVRAGGTTLQTGQHCTVRAGGTSLQTGQHCTVRAGGTTLQTGQHCTVRAGGATLQTGQHCTVRAGVTTLQTGQHCTVRVGGMLVKVTFLWASKPLQTNV
jgi:hypothetical protein